MFRKSLIALFLSSALLAHASPVAEKSTENKAVSTQKQAKSDKWLEAEKARLQRQEQALERAKARLAAQEKAIAAAKAKLAEQEKSLEPTHKSTRPSKQDFVAKTKSNHAKKTNKQAETKRELHTSVYRLNFASPSQNIVCGGDVLKEYGGARGVSCYLKEIDTKPLQAKPKSCNHKWGQVFELAYIGSPAMGCYNDTPYSLEPQILPYGKTMRGKGWACTSLAQGIRCVNSDKHGFEISRKKQKFF